MPRKDRNEREKEKIIKTAAKGCKSLTDMFQTKAEINK